MKKTIITCFLLMGVFLFSGCSAILGPCIKYNSADFDTVIINVKSDSTIIQEVDRFGQSANPIKNRIVQEAVLKLTNEIDSENLKIKVKLNEPCSPAALSVDGDLILLEHKRGRYEGVMQVVITSCATQKEISSKKHTASNGDTLDTARELGRNMARQIIGTLTSCQERAPQTVVK